MVMVHGGTPVGGPALMARTLWLATRVSVYAATLRASWWCYGYVLVQRGGRVHWWWPRHDNGVMSTACACSATTSMGLGGVSAARDSPLVSKTKGWRCSGGSWPCRRKQCSADPRP